MNILLINRLKLLRIRVLLPFRVLLFQRLHQLKLPAGRPAFMFREKFMNTQRAPVSHRELALRPTTCPGTPNVQLLVPEPDGAVGSLAAL